MVTPDGHIQMPRLGRWIRLQIFERCASCRVGVYVLRRGEDGGVWYGCERCLFTALLPGDER